MYSKPLFIFTVIFSVACNNSASSLKEKNTTNVAAITKNIENPYKHINDIPLPEGYTRIAGENNSFAAWLENLQLKKNKTVYLFDGRVKTNQNSQFAVVDISIGDKDLQQCADAVMRLRAEYLFSGNRFDEISFSDNANTAYHFHQPYTKENLLKYLTGVFGMCGTSSLAKQLKQVNIEDIHAGDVLIRGGFPGHAIIVVDIAQNKAGKKIYLLAQSATPAQDVHVIVNPANPDLSPWYEVNDEKFIRTPEYIFLSTEFKEW